MAKRTEPECRTELLPHGHAWTCCAVLSTRACLPWIPLQSEELFAQVMIRNIPTEYTQDELIMEVSEAQCRRIELPTLWEMAWHA